MNSLEYAAANASGRRRHPDKNLPVQLAVVKFTRMVRENAFGPVNFTMALI